MHFVFYAQVLRKSHAKNHFFAKINRTTEYAILDITVFWIAYLSEWCTCVWLLSSLYFRVHAYVIKPNRSHWFRGGLQTCQKKTVGIHIRLCLQSSTIVLSAAGQNSFRSDCTIMIHSYILYEGTGWAIT